MPINSEMSIVDGKLVLGKAACTNCFGEGKRARVLPCRKCNGTGNGPRGGRGGCRTCTGFGKEYDHVNKVDCPQCVGKGLDPNTAADATIFDSMPDEMWQGFEFRVVRSDRPQTWSEQYLAIGCIYSVTDYGRHKSASDAELIAEVKKTRGHQVCKVLGKDNVTVASHIAILTSDGGYTPVAVFEK